VKANTLANTSVEQLALAFTSKAGNALKTVGKSVEEGAAALAVFADQGIKGERAGTLLTNTIFGLTDSLEKNGAQYKELGIELFDNEGKMLSFAGIAEQFTGVLGTMSTEQKLTTLSQLGFNKQAREGILALVGNEEALAEYEKKLKEAGGTVDEVSGKQLETFNAQMELMKSRLMDVAIQIGSELAPKLLTLFDRIAPIIDKAAPVMLALFEKIESILADMSAELAPLIEAALPDLRQLFDDLREPIGHVLEFLTVLAKEILGAVIGLVTTPAFLEALGTIGKSFGVIAENVAAFLKSPVVDFLMGLISNTIIVGLNVLATAIQIVANTFAAAVSAIEAFNRTTPKAQSIPSTPSRGGTSGYITDNRKQTAPKFAEGGIVMPTPGGTLGIIGEAGQAEAVIPLDKLDRYTNGGGNNFTITVNAGMGSDGGRIGQLIVDEIKKFERSNGPVFAGV
jgi:hypothetical protein